MKLPRDLPKPLYIRPNDYVTLYGADYIIRRNEFGQMTKVLGRVSRRLPSEKDVIWSLRSLRPVGVWGNKYFMFERVDEEVLPEIKNSIWDADKRRGVERPVIDPEGEIFDF
ncbi:MAG: hypothetical protein V2A61_05555 [Calditrichota bacterium]